ncbi:hypothetical protein V496_08877 [Pseudogymnoascus sp. VKM F-4515 (FW-2607)]|nr:hypothetical protein V496_08877 [Pseudogymnoascus sp. VKM F-4515 (FW-2607)]
MLWHQSHAGRELYWPDQSGYKPHLVVWKTPLSLFHMLRIRRKNLSAVTFGVKRKRGERGGLGEATRGKPRVERKA